MDTKDFLTTIFGENHGYMFISTKSEPQGGIDQHAAFDYPSDLPRALSYIRAHADEDVYFSPMLYSVPKRRASSVSCTPVIYADTDSFDPNGYFLEPTINVQTSEFKTHSYWVLDPGMEYSPAEVSETARVVALTHAKKINGEQAGVDPSGWDLTQLLRIPNTLNEKYEPAFEVFVRDFTGDVYALEDFEEYYNADSIPQRVLSADAPMPEKLPPATDVLRKITADKKLLNAYTAVPRGNEDWSDKLYHFVSMMYRAGFEPEEVLVGAWSAQSNKYKRDGRPMEDLWKYDVLKAGSDPENEPIRKVDKVAAEPVEPHDAAFKVSNLELEFLTPEEREMLTSTFVDEYVEWATARTDSPVGYHIASALSILSAVLGEWGQAYPLFGEMNLGLFFVVMGETTKTRKSTSRNLMKKFLRFLQTTPDYQYILTSDATEEAMLNALADRANQSSVYDRDELQKLLRDIKGGKGYLAGFLEFLNECYDGTARGRMRTTRTTMDTPVVFVQYLMGIRSQIQSELELSDFMSGWGPRNIFVRGESPERSRAERRLKQGNPDKGDHIDGMFYAVAMNMMNARDNWSDRVPDRAHKQIILFDDDAWERLMDYGDQLEEYVKGHPRADVLEACSERLLLNVLKVATLFAMYDNRTKGTMQDVLNAIYYGMQWIEDLVIVVEGVTESSVQRDLDRLENYLIDHDGLVTYAQTLKWATQQGYNRKELTEIIETLKDSEVLEVVNDANSKMSLSLTYV